MLGVLLGAIDEISRHNQWQIRHRKILLCPEQFKHMSSNARHLRDAFGNKLPQRHERPLSTETGF